MIVFVLLETEDGANPEVFQRGLSEFCDDWRVTTDPPVRVYIVREDDTLDESLN